MNIIYTYGIAHRLQVVGASAVGVGLRNGKCYPTTRLNEAIGV